MIEQTIGALFGSLAFIVGIALAIFWMVVAWRAMRAHERIADALEKSQSKPADKSVIDAEAVKACASCGKLIPKSYTKCFHCGNPQP